jgi:hypothetical protein
MPNKTNTDLDLLIKIANGDNSAIQQVKSLHQLQMQYTIRRIIEKSGLHKKLSVHYRDVIEDIEQETWIKLLRKLKDTPDIKKDEWLLNTKLIAILIKLTTDCALYYTSERGKKRNQKVDKNIPDGAPVGFVSLEKTADYEPSLLPIREVISPEDFINNKHVETEFFEKLGAGIEKEIMSLLFKGYKRKEIVDTLKVTLYKYNQSLDKIKVKAQELELYDYLLKRGVIK